MVVGSAVGWFEGADGIIVIEGAVLNVGVRDGKSVGAVGVWVGA